MPKPSAMNSDERFAFGFSFFADVPSESRAISRGEERLSDDDFSSAAAPLAVRESASVRLLVPPFRPSPIRRESPPTLTLPPPLLLRFRSRFLYPPSPSGNSELPSSISRFPDRDSVIAPSPPLSMAAFVELLSFAVPLAAFPIRLLPSSFPALFGGVCTG